MRFTLVYRGDLPPSGSARDKWRIRRELEPQLRRLWFTPPMDALAKYQDGLYRPADCYVGRRVGEIEYVPLISPALSLQASLEVLLLSSRLPGGLINQSGDIDNRLKTLFDALSVPSSAQQVPEDADTEDDSRVFCLLDDDRLVTRVDVSNDRLLSISERSRETLVLIRVQPVAFRVTTANLGIAV